MIYIRSWYITKGWAGLRSNKLLILLILLLIPMAVFGQTIFQGNGKRFSKVAQKTREPKIIVDTVNVVAGFGTLVLNKTFTREKHSVAATDNMNIFITVTGLITDTSETVYYYGCYLSKGGDSIIVKSSGGTADTSKVVVQIILK